MKSRIVILLVVALSIVALIGCESAGTDAGTSSDGGGSDSSVTTKNVPDRFSVDPPDSLQNSVGSTASVSASAEESYAYDEIVFTIEEVEFGAMNTAINFVIVDEAIDGLTPSASQRSDKTVVLTQAMANTINSILTESFGEMEGFSTADFVGQEFGLTDFYFRDSASDKYDVTFEATVTFPGGDGFTSDLAYSWSTDKTRVRASESFSDAAFGEEISITYSYDDSEKKSTVKYQYAFDGVSGTSQVTLQEKADDPNNGVFVTYSASDEFDGASFTYSTSGFADDNGGYLETTYTDSFGTSSYEEGFDATGTLTYLKVDGTVITGDSADSTYLTAFGDYEDSSFDRAYTGAVNGDYYLVSDTDLGASFDDANWDAFASVVGDAIGTAADQVNVLLWQDVAAGATLYVYKESYNGETGTFTYTKGANLTAP